MILPVTKVETCWSGSTPSLYRQKRLGSVGFASGYKASLRLELGIRRSQSGSFLPKLWPVLGKADSVLPPQSHLHLPALIFHFRTALTFFWSFFDVSLAVLIRSILLLSPLHWAHGQKP